MLPKWLSQFGINDLKINTVVDNNSFYVNGKLHGSILIEGDNSSEEIYNIKLEVIEKIEIHDPTSDFKVLDNILYTYEIKDKFTVQANEKISRKFSVALPLENIKGKPDQITIRTHIYLANAVDNYDEDQIDVIY